MTTTDTTRGKATRAIGVLALLAAVGLGVGGLTAQATIAKPKYTMVTVTETPRPTVSTTYREYPQRIGSRIYTRTSTIRKTVTPPATTTVKRQHQFSKKENLDEMIFKIAGFAAVFGVLFWLISFVKGSPDAKHAARWDRPTPVEWSPTRPEAYAVYPDPERAYADPQPQQQTSQGRDTSAPIPPDFEDLF